MLFRSFLKEVGKKPGKLRIAFSTKPMLGKNVHPDCIKGVEETVELLKSLGHEVAEDAPAINGPKMWPMTVIMVDRPRITPMERRPK